MPARKPNFFIVGAPKCGTSSLAAWLGSHPEACVSKPKEPHFFYPYNKGRIRTVRDYERCFAHAQPHHKAIGEASTHTIYSSQAIKDILEYQPQAKFIVCLRNPVEMIFSLHNHYFFDGEQRIKNFLTAWNSDVEISPEFHHRAYNLNELYRHSGALGTHYRNVREALPADRILTLLLDDLIVDETRELTRITDFLEISRSSIPYPQSNIAKKNRLTLLKYVAKWLAWCRQKSGIRKSLGIGGRIERANTATGTGATVLAPEARAILVGHFRDEITILERLLDRDLSHWAALGTVKVLTRHSGADMKRDIMPGTGSLRRARSHLARFQSAPQKLRSS